MIEVMPRTSKSLGDAYKKTIEDRLIDPCQSFHIVPTYINELNHYIRVQLSVKQTSSQNTGRYIFTPRFSCLLFRELEACASPRLIRFDKHLYAFIVFKLSLSI